MIPFLQWLLPVLGCTLIVTCSTLFRSFREFWEERWPWLYQLLICPMCAGWWIGLSFSLLGHGLIPWEPPKVGYLDAGLVRLLAVAFMNACAASFACWTAHVLLCRAGQAKLLSSRPDLRGGWRPIEEWEQMEQTDHQLNQVIFLAKGDSDAPFVVDVDNRKDITHFQLISTRVG